MEGPRNRVAVIGAGPGGLVAARWLKAHGFEPGPFEQSDRIGGQWNIGSEHSGVWPGMRAVTSCAMTRFSDLDYPEDTPTFPRASDVSAYLESYAAAFGLAEHLRPHTRVEAIIRHAGSWLLHGTRRDGAPLEAAFERVVIATGRHATPACARIPGLHRFTAPGGILHSCDYDGPHRFRRQTVVVAGGGVSALEIASELARSGARVVCAMRRAPVVATPSFDGVPLDNLAFTRFAALADGAALSPPAHRLLPDCVINEHFSALVEADRIDIRPWPREIRGRLVRFADGSGVEANSILFATGYATELPFLGVHRRPALSACPEGDLPDLYEDTFHPDLPGIAFVGLGPLAGPGWIVAELQARWISYAWAGIVPLAAPDAMRDALDPLRASPGAHSQRMDVTGSSAGTPCRRRARPCALAWLAAGPALRTADAGILPSGRPGCSRRCVMGCHDRGRRARRRSEPRFQ